MSKICEKCGRGPTIKIFRSHSNIAVKRRQRPNLQGRKINGKRTLICTKCLKTLTKA
ncbi:50S ribosomal protein L28 [Candidatus Falkowbacteria bacterium]|nr:50S ribosomal protein L28 [Candidatus Falkowbacteria bacterium]